MDANGGFYISQVKQLQDRIFSRLLKNAGLDISGNQGRILFVLWKEDNLPMGEISRRTSLAKNTLTIVIDGMVEKGLLARNLNPDNKRQSIISLTDFSKSMKQTYEDVSQQMNEIFYTGFSFDETYLCEGYLQRIVENLTEAERQYKEGDK